MLIKNVIVLTMNSNKDIIENGVVVIDNDVIVDIGGNELLSKYPDHEIIDGEEGILVPGFVNAHTHCAMTAFRSLGDDVADRLKRYLFPLEKMLVDKELVSLGSKYGICEMALSGVTTFADMYYYEDEVAKSTKEVGLRGVLGETIVDFVAPDADKAYEGLDYCQWFIDKWKEDELIIPSVAPHAPYTNDTEHLQKALNLAESKDVPILMHIAEMTYESEKYMKEYNLTPVQYLDKIGVLNSRMVGAHLIYVNNEDLRILKEKEVGISHNIGANAKGAHGVAPAYKMYNMNLKLGLGTDGPMSGNTLDIFTQMGLVAKIHKLVNNDRTIFSADQIVEMATLGGARALNLDSKIGSIEIGKKADLVIVETKSINMQPIYDYYSVLVYSANASNVSTVIVNGKVIVKDKALLTQDYSILTNEFKNIKNRVMSAARSL
ncbi:amidohydrolase [Proteiniborus sp. MB09-C3]|uniref:amidohydrolase n=1 Tax=Proteiniborus sp. MB09-C3 TaxID=3050072 RepID=UPI0025539E61|nr:amidohydrolase [Proteiniborus sp. MB09-C3]WIV12223.1 amidohydrolase [Proteiniborus sp. MB09-C3]